MEVKIYDVNGNLISSSLGVTANAGEKLNVQISDVSGYMDYNDWIINTGGNIDVFMTPSGGTATITFNIYPSNASIYINNSQQPISGNTYTTTVGATINYRIVATGYNDYEGTIVVQNSNETITRTLSETTISVTRVVLSDNSLNLAPGETESLTATVYPINASNKNVVWASDDTNVATVDQFGDITAVSDGIANISVTTEDGNKTATCEVTVESSEELFDLTINNQNPPSDAEVYVYANNIGTQETSFASGTKIDIAAFSENYQANISTSSFTITEDTTVNITWTHLYTISYTDDSEGDDGPDTNDYVVKVNGVAIENEEQFADGTEVTISVDVDDDFYDLPEIYIDGDLYDGSEFILNDNVMCILKWFRKKEVTIYTNAGSVTVDGVVGYTDGSTFKAYDGTTVSWSASGSGLISDSGEYTVESPYELEIQLNSSEPIIPTETYCATWTNNSSVENEDLVVKFATTNDDWENVSEAEELCNLADGETVYIHIESDGYSDIDMSHVINGDDYEFEIIDSDWTSISIPVSGISIDSSLTIPVGHSDVINSGILPSNASNQRIAWISDDTSVAYPHPSSDTSSCTINARSVGTATITATTEDGGFTDTCSVTVVPTYSVSWVNNCNDSPVGYSAFVSVDGASRETWYENTPIDDLLPGTTIDLTIEASGYEDIEKSITIINQNETFSITCSDFVPNVNVQSITIDPSTITLDVGETEYINVTTVPSSASNLITWSSSNDSIATVDQYGEVTAVANGTAIITASAGNQSDTCTVIVQSKQHVSASIQINNVFEDPDNPGNIAVNYDVTLVPGGDDATNYGDVDVWFNFNGGSESANIELTTATNAILQTNMSSNTYIPSEYISATFDDTGLESSTELSNAYYIVNVSISG